MKNDSNIEELCKIKKIFKILYTLLYMTTFITMWVFAFKNNITMFLVFLGITGVLCVFGEKYKLDCCH